MEAAKWYLQTVLWLIFSSIILPQLNRQEKYFFQETRKLLAFIDVAHMRIDFGILVFFHLNLSFNVFTFCSAWTNEINILFIAVMGKLTSGFFYYFTIILKKYICFNNGKESYVFCNALNPRTEAQANTLATSSTSTSTSSW